MLQFVCLPAPFPPGRVLRKKKKKTLSLRYKGCPKTYAGFLLWELSIPNSARIAGAIPNWVLVIPNFGVHVHQNRVFGPKIAIFGPKTRFLVKNGDFGHF